MTCSLKLSHSLPYKTLDPLSSSNPNSTVLKRKLIRGTAKVSLFPRGTKSHFYQPQYAEEQWKEKDPKLYALLLT